MSPTRPILHLTAPPRDPVGDSLASWERDLELRQSQNWAGLVRHRRRIARRFPDEPQARLDLAEALALAGRLHDAMDLLSALHRRNPDSEAVHRSILDLLMKTFQTPDDFDWIRWPRILRLEEAAEPCLELLANRSALTATALYTALAPWGYGWFSPADLGDLLVKDARFESLKPKDLSEEVRFRGRPDSSKG